MPEILIYLHFPIFLIKTPVKSANIAILPLSAQLHVSLTLVQIKTDDCDGGVQQLSPQSATGLNGNTGREITKK